MPPSNQDMEYFKFLYTDLKLQEASDSPSTKNVINVEIDKKKYGLVVSTVT
jgi:hypothetical protein